jgi:hypothetical protein
MNSKLGWTEQDILGFSGQEETLRLEFKSGALFEKPESSWISDISREVSAFASTEGGVLVLGVKEEKQAKARVAGAVDGVPDLGRDLLQRKIEGNVFPYLPGIRVHRIPITSSQERVVFVVEVPQGTTAHQAYDRKYYGRSEVQAVPLPDHEIRVRMTRGHVARASLMFRLLRVTLGAAAQSELRAKHAKAIEAFARDADAALAEHPHALLEMLYARFTPDEFEFELVLRNDGELTIRDPAVEVTRNYSFDSFGNRRLHPPVVSRHEMRGEVIFPGDERLITGTRSSFRQKRAHVFDWNESVCQWRVFLDNAPPSMGTLRIEDVIQMARERAGAQSGV